MAASLDTSSYNEHFLRLHLLEVKGGTLVLRELFLKIVKNSVAKGDVDRYLNLFRHDLINKKSTTSAEYQVLFPSNGKTVMKKWDISLLAFILIYCCTVEGQLSLKGKLDPKEILKQEVKTAGGLDSFLSKNKAIIDEMKLTDEQCKDINLWDTEPLLRVLFKFCSSDRFQKLCKDVVTRQVELCGTVIQFLSKNEHTFKKLTQQGKLPDFQQLFPNSSLLDIKNWDNEVLLIVLLNACQCFSQTTFDDVKTIKMMRNELGAHAGHAEINDEDYKKKSHKLNNAITCILCSELPDMRKSIDVAIYDILCGPIEIASSITILTECYRNYDTKYTNVLKLLSAIKSKTESIEQTMEAGFATTSQKIDQSETNIIQKMIELKRMFEVYSTEDPVYTDTREIECCNVIFDVSGISKETVDHAELLIVGAFHGTKDHETEKIQKATDAIKELLSKGKTAIVKVQTGSVIVVVKCVSVLGLHALFNTLDSNEFKGRLKDLATVLTELTGCQIGVTAYIPAPSLQIMLDQMKQIDSRVGILHTGPNEYHGSVKMRLKAASLKGLANIWQTVQGASMTQHLQILSESLSSQLNEHIEVSVGLQPEEFQSALQSAEDGITQFETKQLHSDQEMSIHEHELEADTSQGPIMIPSSESNEGGSTESTEKSSTESTKLVMGGSHPTPTATTVTVPFTNILEHSAFESNVTHQEREEQLSDSDDEDVYRADPSNIKLSAGIRATTSGDLKVEEIDDGNVPTPSDNAVVMAQLDHTSETKKRDRTKMLSEMLWDGTVIQRNQALNSYFVQGMKDGTLDPIRFGTFLIQDTVLCIRVYIALGKAAARADVKTVRACLEHKAGYMEKYYKYLLKEWGMSNISSVIVSKEVQDYCNVLEKVATEYDAIYMLVALTAGWRLFPWLGEQIKAETSEHHLGVYSRWCNLYFDPKRKGYLEMEEIFNDGPIEEEKALQVYADCMKSEAAFFDSVKKP